ncbi:cytochrome c-type biogenesis protein [Telmatobacter bradus]|uniref:cytochrome c-type biogenesis protein n=1 Tax=Telmatobacter bradus TaxID=474953 RepID=UPI003B42EB2C
MHLAMLLLFSIVSLTPAQKQEVDHLERQLMAPCCYTQTIHDHMSDVAEQMREEVVGMVAAGKSETEIKNYYRAKYGETILVTPAGRTGLVTFGVPVAVSLAALLLLALVLRRRVLARSAPQAAFSAASAPAAGSHEEARIAQIRRELGDAL